LTQLHWPNSTGASGAFDFKTCADDFCVAEFGTPKPDGRKVHAWLRIEKRSLSTSAVVGLLAQATQQPESAVGYAGMKDVLAVTEQWFSLPADGLAAAQVAVEQDARLRCLDEAMHSRKLRRGQLLGNRFVVRLRNAAAVTDLQLSKIQHTGLPNYFGLQRFGRQGSNLQRASQWLQQRQTPRGRARPLAAFTKGIYLSALRGFLFNEVLAARVRAGNWHQVLDGDHCLGAAPTGPLWGRGRSASQRQAALLETAALADHQAWCRGLEYAGVDQARRRLCVVPQQLDWQRSWDDLLTLRFALPSGAYATSLLAELGQGNQPVVAAA